VGERPPSLYWVFKLCSSRRFCQPKPSVIVSRSYLAIGQHKKILTIPWDRYGNSLDANALLGTQKGGTPIEPHWNFNVAYTERDDLVQVSSRPDVSSTAPYKFRTPVRFSDTMSRIRTSTEYRKARVSTFTTSAHVMVLKELVFSNLASGPWTGRASSFGRSLHAFDSFFWSFGKDRPVDSNRHPVLLLDWFIRLPLPKRCQQWRHLRSPLTRCLRGSKVITRNWRHIKQTYKNRFYDVVWGHKNRIG